MNGAIESNAAYLCPPLVAQHGYRRPRDSAYIVPTVAAHKPPHIRLSFRYDLVQRTWARRVVRIRRRPRCIFPKFEEIRCFQSARHC